jgi:hypothetical protein
VKSRILSGCALALVCSTALATKAPQNPPHNHDIDATATGVGVGVGGDSNAESTSIAAAGASANSAAGAVSSSSNTNINAVAGGKGGEASAVGIGGDASARAISGDSTSHATVGNTTAEAGDSEASANNELTLTQNYTTRRQAPSVAQGSLMIGSCGAGGNAGGSNSGGAAFFGITWTPRDCKLLLAAAAYQSLGMNDASCEMINGISVVKKQWKELGIEPPKCEVKLPEPVAAAPASPTNVPAQDMSAYVTKDELAEHERRIINALTTK